MATLFDKVGVQRAAAPRQSTGTWRYKHRQSLTAWIILTPVFLYFFVFAVLPVVVNFLVSFTQWNGIVGSPTWIAFDNYLRYLRPPYPIIVFNTLMFAGGILFLQTVISFGVALLLNEKVIGRGLFRTLWYLPTLTSAAVMTQVVLIFISPYDGVLNSILQSLGQRPIIWTLDPFWMRITIIVFSLWRGLGTPVVLFLAALQGIHRELYEAAQVDGANGVELVRFITLPLMQPMITFVLVTGFIANFQIFEAVLLISKGGPSNQTNVMMLQIYNDAFTNSNLGLAVAGAMVMVFILFWFSLYAMRVMNKEGKDD